MPVVMLHVSRVGDLLFLSLQMHLELIQEGFCFPSTCPVPDTAVKAAFVLIRLDQVVQATVATAEDDVLPAKGWLSRLSFARSGPETHFRRRRTGQKSLEPSPT